MDHLPFLSPEPLAELTEVRHDLHAHPELGHHEVRTAALAAARLRAWGVEVTEGVGGTGVVGTIRGTRHGSRSIGLRADMDALPISEQTGLVYASQHDGVMHACGHDGHTTVLLGAARDLASHPNFAGTVHLIFQPAEEGLGGANRMIEDGLFERFPCDAVYALHTAPRLPVGMIAGRTGPMMAGIGTFDVTFSGTGGHGGLAVDKSVDLSIVQANYVMALQTVVSRNVPATDTAVVSVCYIGGGSPAAKNVMPEGLALGGTLRYFTEHTQTVLGQRIEDLAHSIAAAYAATARVQVCWLDPPLVNPPEQAGIVIRAATAAVGAERVISDITPVTASEDFAVMMEARPGGFVYLGNGAAADGTVHNLHTPHYDFNDHAIPDGSGLLGEPRPAGVAMNLRDVPSLNYVGYR